MAAVNVALQVDLSQAAQHWQAARAAFGDLGAKVANVQQALPSVTVTGQVGATPGTVTFTASAATLRARIGDLLAAVEQVRDELAQAAAILDAGLSVTVTQVS